MSFVRSAMGEGGGLQRLGGAWEYSHARQVGETAYLSLGTGLGLSLAASPRPSDPSPSPPHALPGEGGQGPEKHSPPTPAPRSSRESLAGCLPRVPRLAGCGRPSSRAHSHWALAQGCFVTRRLRWYCAWGLGFLGSVADCDPKASGSQIWLAFLPPGRSGVWT